jgi:SanA protein
VIEKTVKLFLLMGFVLLFTAALFLGAPRLLTELYGSGKTFTLENAPHQPVAVVFGAGLTRDGRPGAVLRDRVATAADLYFGDKVEKLLMSGDNRFENYNEPAAMANYAVELGVPSEDIILDYAGQRTYDTCFRAKHIFGVEQAILVTQAFHLPRAIYTCSQMEIEAVGVRADQREYSQRSYLYWNLREIAATTNALWEIHFSRPLPILGNYEPIFPEDQVNNQEGRYGKD